MVLSTACSIWLSVLSIFSGLLRCSTIGTVSSLSVNASRNRVQSTALKFHGLFLTGFGTGKSIWVMMGKWSAMGGIFSRCTSHLVIQLLMSLVTKMLSSLVCPPLELMIVGVKGEGLGPYCGPRVG